MSVFKDLWRIMKVGHEQRRHLDYPAMIAQSADLAEQYASYTGGGVFDPNTPTGTHGAASANPFANMQFMQNGIPASGTVVSLAMTEKAVDGVPVYAVQLDVLVDGRDPYRTVYRTLIASAALPNWQPGAVVPLRVSHVDPHSVMVG